MNLMRTVLMDTTIVDNGVTALEAIAEQITKFATPLSIVTLVICGLIMMMGKEMSQVAKDWIRRIIIGMVVVLCASSAVTWISTTFTFTVT